MDIKELMVAANTMAKKKGWWDGWENLTDEQKLDKTAGKLLLVHSEISEAAEELRNKDKLKTESGFDLTDIYYEDEAGDWTSCFTSVYQNPDHPYNKPEGIAVELADAIIRIVDLAEQIGLPLDLAMEQKMIYNGTRSLRHGNKTF